MLDMRAWREWRRWVPAECPGCGRRVSGQGLCPDCLEGLWPRAGCAWCPVCAHPLGPGGCPDCAHRRPAFDRVVAAFDYEGLGERLIKDFKFAGRLALAGLLADRLAHAVRFAAACDAARIAAACGAGDSPAPAVAAEDQPVAWVVPVPARRDSLRRRGFSPPAEVARILARRLHLPYRLDGLRRCREGSRQSTLDRAHRLQAPQGAYACGRGQEVELRGRHIVVVDDVLTTGATLDAAASVLKAAGAARVTCWVLARAVLQ